MNVAERYQITSAGSKTIAADLEAAIDARRFAPGKALPPIRVLASSLGVSPATVANSYRILAERGLVAGAGRRGTLVRPPPELSHRLSAALPPGVCDLTDGSPDPTLLPPLDGAVSGLDLTPRRYEEAGSLPALVEQATGAFRADGLPEGPVAVVGGARDGIERALAAWTRPGDRVALEDPCFTGIIDLVGAMGLEAVPVAVDPQGPQPAAMVAALEAGVTAVVVTPRAHNPTGALLGRARAATLRNVLDRHPDVLLVEDDHAGAVAGVSARTLVSRRRERWTVVRSVSKALGPDLRLGLLTGDSTTVARVEGRQLVGTGWVSTLLQQIVVSLLSDPATAIRLAEAAATYRQRREAAVRALRAQGVAVRAPSGTNLWITVPEEQTVVRGLLAAGWAVGAGERHRIATPPGIRVATTTLTPSEAARFAADLASVLAGRARRPAS